MALAVTSFAGARPAMFPKRPARLGVRMAAEGDNPAPATAAKSPASDVDLYPSTPKKAPVSNTPAPVAAAKVSAQDVDLYPEWGKNPYEGDFSNVPWPGWAYDRDPAEIAKWQERELIHARWAMLGTAGAWAGEVGTGVPWFKAGALCTPKDCSALNTIFPGQVVALAPEGGQYPNFNIVLGLEILMIGTAELYRTGLIPNCFPELKVGDPHPGGEHFDPLGLGKDPELLAEYKLKELKNGRLAMAAWLGYIVQAFVTSPGTSKLPSYTDGAPGPYANWLAHLDDPLNDNIYKYIGFPNLLADGSIMID